jgi:PST family polysaccharide transporter
MNRYFTVLKAQVSNKENKGLIQNLFSLSILQIASYIIPLITLPYLIRVLGADNFGKISFATAYVMYFIALVDYSFPLKATKEIAVSDKSKEQLSRIFSKVMYTKIVILLIGFLLTAVLTTVIPILNEYQRIIMYTYLMVLGMIFYPFWFFQGIEKMKFITYNNLLSRTISVILIFLIVKTKQDYIYVPIINSLGFLIGGIYAIFIIYRRFNTQFIFIPIKEIVQEIKDGWNIFLIRFLPNLYNNSSVFILGLIDGSVAVAYYSAGKRIVDAVQSLNQVVTRVFYPYLNRKSDKFNKAKYIIMGSGVLLSLSLIVFSYPIYKILLTEEFLKSLYILLILSLSPFFISVDSAYGANGLLRLGNERNYKNIVLACALIGMLSSIFLINIFSFYGAAVNLVLIRAAIAFFVFLKYRNFSREKME